MDEFNLFEEAKQGNKKAFEQIITTYHNQLYYTALGIVKSPWDALDICQDTFLKAYTSLNHLKDVSKFRPWINRILINKCNDYFRQFRKTVTLQEIEKDCLTQELSEDNMDLLKSLSSLKQEFRIVLVLRYFQDLPIKDIAMILDCPEGTVKSRISYALKELRKSMQTLDKEGIQ
ncbi:MAG: RNA polymerase sigma factor [Clostridia bacterium]|nr:RNA polymerase sigma factor [Clostridia bacterium]